MKTSAIGGWVILLSFAVTLMLTVMPLPAFAAPWRPAWALMVCIFWCMEVPHRIGIGITWMVGLILDVLMSSVLGLHALSFTIIAYIVVRTYRWTRIFPLFQQAFFIGILLALEMLLVFWIKSLLGFTGPDWSEGYSIITSVMLWPWLFIVLKDLCGETGIA